MKKVMVGIVVAYLLGAICLIVVCGIDYNRQPGSVFETLKAVPDAVEEVISENKNGPYTCGYRIICFDTYVVSGIGGLYGLAPAGSLLGWSDTANLEEIKSFSPVANLARENKAPIYFYGEILMSNQNPVFINGNKVMVLWL